MKLYKINWWNFWAGIGMLAFCMFIVGSAMEMHPSWEKFGIGIGMTFVLAGIFFENMARQINIEGLIEDGEDEW